MAQQEIGVRRITIIGGGVVGLCCAVNLARAGHRVVVLDDDTRHAAASWGNAGHLATEQVAPLASPDTLRTAFSRRFGAGGALDLPLRTARHWLPFIPRFIAASTPAKFRAGNAALRTLLADALPAWQRVATLIEQPALVKADGHYVLWESTHSAVAGAANWRAVDTGTAKVHTASDSDIARITAAVVTSTPIVAGIRFEGSGQIADLTQLASALEAAVVRHGGRIVREKATLSVEQRTASVPGYEADLVIVAAGAHSRSLIERAGHRAPVIAERGYHIRAAANDWPADLPPLVFEDRSMIVTRYADVVQAASFVEFGGPASPPDARKWARLEHHVRALGLPMRPPFSRWMGSRPTLPDYLPAIGRSQRARNLIYAFGHQHLGLTLAAITAEHVTALVAGNPPSTNLAPFDLERFGGRG